MKSPIIAAGTAGYMLLEGWSFTGSLYMTMMTVTTVGYGEVHPQGTAGRYFTIALMLGGIFDRRHQAGLRGDGLHPAARADHRRRRHPHRHGQH